MVSSQSIFFMVFSSLIAFLFPIGLAIYFKWKWKISIKAVLVGALIFFVFQMVIRIPLLQISATQGWYKAMAQNAVLIALFLGITAGMFEEVGRFIGFKYLLKKNLSRKNGIAFGIGHGGIEAIILVGLTNINNIVSSLMINSGVFDAMVAPKLPGETAQMIKNTLISTSPLMFAFGGIERIFAITIQIALSLVVLYAVMYRKNIVLLYAILLHAVVDSPVVILSANKASIWVTEGFVFLCAIASLIFILKSKKIFNDEH